METTGRLDEALTRYLNRQDRAEHPAGTFDSKRRWYPTAEERRDCCNVVRSPSAAYPYSLMKHCRSVEHIAALYGVDAGDLRRAARRARPAQRLQGAFYKAVAVAEDGRLLSIYDGTTEYVLGQQLTQAVRTGHGGGYYVYASEQDARNANVPNRSALVNAPRAILQVEAHGQYTRYACDCDQCRDANEYHDFRPHADKLAFSSITPVAVVSMPTMTAVA